LEVDASVRAVAVHNEVYLLLLRKVLFQVVQDSDKFPSAMPLLAGACDFVVHDTESPE